MTKISRAQRTSTTAVGLVATIADGQYTLRGKPVPPGIAAARQGVGTGCDDRSLAMAQGAPPSCDVQ